MLRLINAFAYDFDTAKYGDDRDKMKKFILHNGMDGIELMSPLTLNEAKVPKECVKGVHLANYPDWIDFWRGDRDALIEKMGDEDGIKRYYGGLTRDAIVNRYRDEIRAAEKMGARYAVFHVSNVAMYEMMNYEFKYDDDAVAGYSIELINEIFDGLDCSIEFLLENLWWPGMRLNDKSIVRKLLSGIRYDNVGIMLDTGHLMNGNYDLKSESDGVQFIIDTARGLGEYKKLIKGLHLQCSLSGEFTKKLIEESKGQRIEKRESFIENEIYHALSKTDWHKPFHEKCVKRIIDEIKPDYVVYEFISSTLEELEGYIKTQNEALR